MDSFQATQGSGAVRRTMHLEKWPMRHRQQNDTRAHRLRHSRAWSQEGVVYDYLAGLYSRLIES